MTVAGTKLADAAKAASIAEGLDEQPRVVLPSAQDGKEAHESLAGLSVQRQQTIALKESPLANEIDPKAEAQTATQEKTKQYLTLTWQGQTADPSGAKKGFFDRTHFFGKTKTKARDEEEEASPRESNSFGQRVYSNLKSWGKDGDAPKTDAAPQKEETTPPPAQPEEKTEKVSKGFFDGLNFFAKKPKAPAAEAETTPSEQTDQKAPKAAPADQKSQVLSAAEQKFRAEQNRRATQDGLKRQTTLDGKGPSQTLKLSEMNLKADRPIVKGSGRLKLTNGQERTVKYCDRMSLLDHMVRSTYALQAKAQNTEGTKGVLITLVAGLYTAFILFVAIPVIAAASLFTVPWGIRWGIDPTKVEIFKSSDTDNLTQKTAAADGSAKTGAAPDTRKRSLSAVRDNEDLSDAEEEAPKATSAKDRVSREVASKTAADAQDDKSVEKTAATTMTVSQKIRNGLSNVASKFSRAPASQREIQGLVDKIVDGYQSINRQVQNRSRFYDSLGNDVQEDVQDRLITNLVSALAKHAKGATTDEQLNLFGLFTDRLTEYAGTKRIVDPALNIVVRDSNGRLVRQKDGLIQDQVREMVVQEIDDFRNAFGQSCEAEYLFSVDFQNKTPEEAAEELSKKLDAAVKKGFMTEDQKEAVMDHLRDPNGAAWSAHVQYAVNEIKKGGNKQPHAFGDELVTYGVLAKDDQAAYEDAILTDLDKIKLKKAEEEKTKKAAAEEVTRKAAAEEAARKAVEEAARAKAVAEEAARKEAADKVLQRGLFSQFNGRLARIAEAQGILENLNDQYRALVEKGRELQGELKLLVNTPIPVPVYRPQKDGKSNTISLVKKQEEEMFIGLAIDEMRKAVNAIEEYPGIHPKTAEALSNLHKGVTKAVRLKLKEKDAKEEQMSAHNVKIIGLNDEILARLTQVDEAIVAYKYFASEPRKVNLDGTQKEIMARFLAKRVEAQKGLRREIEGLQQSGAGIVDTNLAGILKRPEAAANALANANPAPRLSDAAAPATLKVVVANGQDPLAAAPAAKPAPVQPIAAPAAAPAPEQPAAPQLVGNGLNVDLDSPRPGMVSRTQAAPTVESPDQEFDLADVEQPQPSMLSKLYGLVARRAAPTAAALPITTGRTIGNAFSID